MRSRIEVPHAAILGSVPLLAAIDTCLNFGQLAEVEPRGSALSAFNGVSLQRRWHEPLHLPRNGSIQRAAQKVTLPQQSCKKESSHSRSTKFRRFPEKLPWSQTEGAARNPRLDLAGSSSACRTPEVDQDTCREAESTRSSGDKVEHVSGPSSKP